ncbi:tRNA A64-2'-O-ribosylphosphate transferase [Thamnocephalis sphaerospora]|uniref:tRNA A64-2'-O-ribosylphosphate transferase n=1 Tax=Thamnocephalis sphaerospora TaxID=78915 RepID=A0A4P9XYG0_9FUNG|nr:tRNA A64-2'-O-ribosylphosphate transferase [Thamnocephalis sphaerospora]|eukprot:RKP10460.1 tRNA A64-2'-O-ribosylphosphate transferase [Thamnocephalis sphaerospora]
MQAPTLAQVTADIRKASRSVYHRLHSIAGDASFVAELADLFPALPVIANERCGSWYTPPAKVAAKAYFKSTDGHHGEWCFSLRRANLHILPLICERGGCLVVDSTRGGKRMPDALSKTVPIWCATLNQAVFADRLKKDNRDGEADATLAEHCALHTLPSMVSRSEHEQISARVPSFVQKLQRAGVEMDRLRRLLQKPLRPIWLTPASRLFIDNPPTYDDAPFIPVICVTASEAVAGGVTARTTGYMYIQGAADDAEAWSRGLTADLFWQHYSALLTASESDCARLVADAVRLRTTGDEDTDGTRLSSHSLYNFIGDTNVAIGGRRSRPPECWDNFDVIINCCELEYEANRDEKLRGRYLFLNIPEGKKGQNRLLATLPLALQFAEAPMREHKRILVHCAKGQDRSVGVALALLVRHLDGATGAISNDLAPSDCAPAHAADIDKTTIQHRLLYIAQYRPQASPSRATINKVNSVFLSPSHM